MSKSTAFSCPDTFNEVFERKDGDQLNTHYCPGCGHGLIHKYMAEAISELGVKDRTILVSPVGCSVFAPTVFDASELVVTDVACRVMERAVRVAEPGAPVTLSKVFLVRPYRVISTTKGRHSARWSAIQGVMVVPFVKIVMSSPFFLA